MFKTICRTTILTSGLLFITIGLQPPAYAYFLDLGNGVRPTGMGEAFVAVADDTNAVFYNPAGLSRLEQLEITGMYSDLYSNLNIRLYNQAQDRLGYNLLAATMPFREIQGGLGLTWKQFHTVFYQENVLTLGYGRKMWSWTGGPTEGGDLDLGCNVKWLQWQIEANSFTTDAFYYPFSEFRKYGFSADAGLMLRLFSNLKIGLSGENIIPANVGLTTTEYVPAVYRLGASYAFNLKSETLDSWLAALEISERNHVYTPKLGLESWWFHRSIGLRAGVNGDNFGCGLSYGYTWKAADLGLQLDYAFTYPWRLADTAGSHWAGMTIRWDLLNPREAEKKQDLERRTRSALRAKGIALAASQAASQSLAEAQQAAQANGPAAAEKVRDTAAKILDLAETSALAAEVVQNAASEAKSDTLTALAAEAAQAAASAASAVLQAERMYKELQAQVASQPAAAPAAAAPEANPTPLPLLPEKYHDRIVVGIETKIITDFGSVRDMEPVLQNLALYLEQAAGMKLEWRLLSPAELLLALHQGELDGVAAYEANLDRYLGSGRLEKALTVRRNCGTDQPCCLIVRANSPIRTLAQARGKRLGYSNGRIAGRLNQLFFNGQEEAPGRYFGSLEKQKNARDSLWALQMEAVDVVAEYAYILDIARAVPEMNLRVIAESAPKPNAPLLLRTSHFPEKNGAMRKLEAALLQLHRDPGHPWLQVFRVQRVVAADEKR